MSSLEDALVAMAELHNINIGRKRIQIQFTRSKVATW